MNSQATGRAPHRGAALGLLLLIVMVASGAAAAESAPPLIPAGALDSKWNPAKLRLPPLGSIPQVQAERMELEDGFVIYLVQDSEFPDLQGTLLIRAGGQYDPPEKAGLGDLTATVLRSGGTAEVPGDSLDARLETIGASIDISTDESSATVSFYCLKEYGHEVLSLLADLLRRPAFPANKLDLAKVRVRRGIAARNDEPGGIARRLMRQLVWGKESPYFRDTEFATLEAIRVEDLQLFHKRFYAPDRMILTLWGDFDPAAMKEELRGLLGEWPRSEEPLPTSPPVPPEEGAGGVYYAEKAQVTQSYVYLGQVGIPASHPDAPAIEVLGELLGGGFSSRIVNLIRTERGLAYAAGAGPGIGYAHPGTFTAYALTRNDSTLVTLDLLRGELARLVTEPPTEQELTLARESLLNSFVFKFQSKGQVASRQAYYEFYGYPPGFLTTYQEDLRKVTAQDILRVARAHLHPDKMTVLIVGNEAGFAQPLSSLGEVRRMDLTIPGGPESGRPARP